MTPACAGSIPAHRANGGIAEQVPSAGSNEPGDARSIRAAASKLYVVVRSGMGSGPSACQAIHATRAYAQKYPHIESDWFLHSNTIVVLHSDDLEAVIVESDEHGVSHMPFYEPDWDESGTLTAVCVGPDGKRIVRDLPLLR